ncbi:flagellar biosynthetic protein FliR [Ramlibacter sp. H39-3-26]|uniref:flagellar biosynthetic protein FliR n=1 Tax=Curvibacter soli TaxID=3031331 RepID=UPI0023DC99E7|nr:flagellar biosynthetic protein FliR [Ramlibacter sp. H39-3-26]MDF1484226.1 flagellar biosynthetic protein FliR [Ramlibacter sp. H39-3-26]
MEQLLFQQMVTTLSALWWPFCRVMAMFSAAPVVGEVMVPLSVRALLSLVMAIILLPVSQPVAPIAPISLAALAATAEQVIIGFVLGLAFHLIVAAFMVLGYIVSSQMGLAMALMNDPMNGTSSDVVSSLIYLLVILVFFAVDGHLVLAGVVGASFRAWPVGGGISQIALQTLPAAVAWVFSAALLLATPIIFSTFVVQIGMGFLNRVAPTFNLFSLGFSLITVFGLFVLVHIVHSVPEHYIRMSGQVLEMLRRIMQAGPHG